MVGGPAYAAQPRQAAGVGFVLMHLGHLGAVLCRCVLGDSSYDYM